MANPILDAARSKRDNLSTEIDAMLEEAGNRDVPGFTDEEAETFTEKAAARKKLDAQIVDLEGEQKRADEAAAAAAELAKNERAAVVTREEMTYDRTGRNSFIKDLSHIAAAGIDPSYQGAAHSARERMAQHLREVDVEAKTDAKLAANLRELRRTPDGREVRVNPNTTDGTGGEFVPPLWQVNMYIPLARAGRTIANRIRTEALPPGTDSINLPKIKTGSTTAIQAAQGNAVSSTDITTATVTAAVNTIAGQQDFSMQLLDQSPIDMTSVIFEDLSADYDLQLDKQVIGGTGASGQHLGIYGQTAASANSATSLNTDATKINAVTCASVIFSTGATTSFTQVRSILNGITNIQTLRLRTPTALHAHPRRINSWQFATDSPTATTFDGGRPVFVRYGAFNALGTTGDPKAEGVVGELFGIPVVSDPNIPILCATGSITSGSGDMLGLVFEDDMLLYEGALRMRVLPEILSGTLQMRAQVYAYSAFFPHRYPPSTTLITGTTGLAAASY